MIPTNNPAAVVALADELVREGRVHEARDDPDWTLGAAGIAGVDGRAFVSFLDRYQTAPLHGVILPGHGAAMHTKAFLHAFLPLDAAAGPTLDIYYNAKNPRTPLSFDANHPRVAPTALKGFLAHRHTDQLVVWENTLAAAESIPFPRTDIAALPQLAGVVVASHTSGLPLPVTAARARAAALDPVPPPNRNTIEAWLSRLNKDLDEGHDVGALIGHLEQLRDRTRPPAQRYAWGAALATIAILANISGAAGAVKDAAEWTGRTIPAIMTGLADDTARDLLR